MSEAITLKALADELDLSQKEVKAALKAVGADASGKGDREIDGETAGRVRAYVTVAAAAEAPASVADATGDSSEARPVVPGKRVRVLQNGNLQMEPGEIVELRDDGSAKVRLTAPAFGGDCIELPSGAWEEVK